MKVVDMPEGKNEMIAGIEMLKRNQPEMFEMISLVAAMKWHAFSEYTKAGFTPEQAIELCKQSVISI